MREKGEGKKKCPGSSLVRSPARWRGSYFDIRGFFSFWLSCLYLMQGPARGKDKSTTKNNHPLDALAITPVPVNYCGLWLSELWALRTGSSPAVVIVITTLFLAPMLLNAWLELFPEQFPVYALTAQAQVCKGFLPLPQHFHKKLFTFTVLISPSIKWGY